MSPPSTTIRARPAVRLASLIVAVLGLAACTRDLAQNASGREVYDAVCARCHGGSLEGRLGPALDAGSEAASKPDELYRTAIAAGIGSMPSFGSTLSEAQIEAVIDYMRAVQSGEEIP